MEYMKLKANALTDGERALAVCFDEMSVKGQGDLDRMYDSFVPPAAFAQVIVVRSFLGKLKIPIFVDYDYSVTDEMLISIIAELDCINFHVKIITCDQGLIYPLLQDFFTENKTKGIMIYDSEKRQYKATIPQIIKPYKATRHHSRLMNIIHGHTASYTAIHGHKRHFNTIILFQEYFLFVSE